MFPAFGIFLGYGVRPGCYDAARKYIMNEITSKLRQFIEDKLGVEESTITDSASFYNDLDVDSLDFCELIVDIEKAFDIVIPDDDYDKLRTVGALEKYVSKLVIAKTGGMQHIKMIPGEDRLSA